MSAPPDTLSRLAATIAARRGADPASSYTAKLLAKGPEEAAQKFGEEAVEAVIEATKGDPAALTAEAADVLYHLLVMLTAREVTWQGVLDELERREGLSGQTEKAARTQAPVHARVESAAERAACMALRARVFVEEQGVDAALEFDGLDDTCRHYRSTLGQEIVATARVRWLDGAAKIQRVAVAKAVRGRGVGAALMRHILADVGDSASEAVLDSQVGAIGFYERLGFSAEGPEFLDAGIPHRRMRRPL